MNTGDAVDAVVIGAGVVGLAVGRTLAAAGLETIIVERHRRIGEETSSRNSGVVHSGIYYPAGSLKARLCVRGRELLYSYCRDRGIAHSRCGKLILAQPGQVQALHTLRQRGVDNGVSGLRLLDATEVRGLEPAVRCDAGLWSPDTGIIDVHELMSSLLADVEANAGSLVLDATVERIRVTDDGLEVVVVSGPDETSIFTRRLVNAAGLGAIDVARAIDGYPTGQLPVQYLAKGNYFTCTARPFRHLVYPMPDEAGLGVHATLDLAGCVRFGPDVEWVGSVDYAVDAVRAGGFYDSIRAYWPGLPDGALSPDYSGIRPKLVGPGRPAADFLIARPADHGVPGLVNLFGIESPGLTAALAIGEWACSDLIAEAA